MPTSVLTPGLTAAYSSDITVTDRTTVAIYTALNDHFLLPDEFDFLLPDGASMLLLPDQAGGDISMYDYLEIQIKDPVGTYNPTGLWLKSLDPVKELGPGVYRVARPVTTTALGVQTDAAS